MLEASEQDQHQMDIVVGGMMRQIKKTYKDEFNKVFDGLLEDISVDFDIPLDELNQKYEMKYKFHPRKPRDPAMACKDFTKNGNPCARSKRPGHDYCGIHLRTRGIDPNSVSATVNNEPVNEPEASPQPYVSKARRLKELKTSKNGDQEPDKNDNQKQSKNEDQDKNDDQDKNEDQDEDEPSETETESSTNGSEGETSIELITIEDKQYVVVNGNKIFNHPGKDEIDSINELGQLVGLRLHGGSIEWI